jgi:SAM-dependent methyltransferase
MLRALGYEATGVDPEAPSGEGYRQVEFERAGPFEDVDAIVASTSLHHVADPGEVVERIATSLTRGGTVVALEWASESFDEATARWCFERLGSDPSPGWLQRRRDEWKASGRPWGQFIREWAEREQIHPASTLVRLLDERFDRVHLGQGPYFFADLDATSEEEEQTAIDAGVIRAGRVDYVGRLR